MSDQKALMTVAAILPADRIEQVDRDAEEMRQRLLALRGDNEVQGALKALAAAAAPILARLPPAQAAAVAAFGSGLLASDAYDAACAVAADAGPDATTYRVAIGTVVIDAMEALVRDRAPGSAARH